MGFEDFFMPKRKIIEEEKKAGTPTKEIYSKELRELVREEIKNIAQRKNEELDFLQGIITEPTRLKKEVRTIIKFEIDKKFFPIKEEWREATNKMYQAIREMRGDISQKISKEISLELRKSNIPELIKISMNEVMADDFKPIIEKSISLVNHHFNKKVQRKLKQIINLKTSSIQEIQHLTRDTAIETDEVFLRKMEIEYKGGE